MKTKIIFCITVLICLSFQGAGQTTNSIDHVNPLPIDTLYRIWPSPSPEVLSKGRKVWPLFGAKKMGIGKQMELRVQPLFFFISPNLGLKKGWLHKNSWLISSNHQINYPSIFLNMIAGEGAGGILPDNSQIPPMITLKNELLVGRYWYGLATLRLGAATTFSFGDKDFPDIDLPFLYSRMLSFNHTPNLYAGINLRKGLSEQFHLEADFTAFKVDLTGNNAFVYESQLIVFWKLSTKFAIKAGAAASHGQFPYGKDFRVIPLFDLLYGFGGKGKYTGR